MNRSEQKCVRTETKEVKKNTLTDAKRCLFKYISNIVKLTISDQTYYHRTVYLKMA